MEMASLLSYFCLAAAFVAGAGRKRTLWAALREPKASPGGLQRQAEGGLARPTGCPPGLPLLSPQESYGTDAHWQRGAPCSRSNSCSRCTEQSSSVEGVRTGRCLCGNSASTPQSTTAVACWKHSGSPGLASQFCPGSGSKEGAQEAAEKESRGPSQPTEQDSPWASATELRGEGAAVCPAGAGQGHCRGASLPGQREGGRKGLPAGTVVLSSHPCSVSSNARH